MWITLLIIGVGVGGGLVTAHSGGSQTSTLLWAVGMTVALTFHGIVLLRKGMNSARFRSRTYIAGRDGGPMAGGAFNGTFPLEEQHHG